MKIKQTYQNFWFFPIVSTLLSIPFTLLGWMLFDLIFKGKISSPFFDFLLYFFVWPSVLLDSMGIMVTDHSFGIIPNAIGWGVIGIVISLVRKYSSKQLKR